ncbi:MAG: ParA family partition ATPase [Pseudomonadota bacterium]
MAGFAITVAQQKGGSGKTTLAANLAVEYRRRGHSVAVLDTDPQGSLGRWFMARRDLLGDDDGFEFATASAWGVSYEMEKLRKHNDIVIIDTPPKIDSDLKPTLRASNVIIVPVATSHVDLWATESVLDMARREKRPVLLVLNRASSRAKLTAEVSAQLDSLDGDRAATVLGARVAYAEGLGEGLGVVEKAAKSLAAAEVSALADEIADVLNASQK